MTWYLRPMTLLPLVGDSRPVYHRSRGLPSGLTPGSARCGFRARQDLPVREALVGVGLPGEAERALADDVLVDLVAAAGDRHATHEVELLGVLAVLDAVLAPQQAVRTEDVERDLGHQLHGDRLLVLGHVGEAGDVATASGRLLHALPVELADAGQRVQPRQLLAQHRVVGAAAFTCQREQLGHGHASVVDGRTHRRDVTG